MSRFALRPARWLNDHRSGMFIMKAFGALYTITTNKGKEGGYRLRMVDGMERDEKILSFAKARADEHLLSIVADMFWVNDGVVGIARELPWRNCRPLGNDYATFNWLGVTGTIDRLPSGEYVGAVVQHMGAAESFSDLHRERVIDKIKDSLIRQAEIVVGHLK